MYMYNLMKVCSSMMTCLMRNEIQTLNMKNKIYGDNDVSSSNQEKNLSSNDESIGDFGDKD